MAPICCQHALRRREKPRYAMLIQGKVGAGGPHEGDL